MAHHLSGEDTSKSKKRKTDDLLENRVIPNIYAMRKTLESLEKRVTKPVSSKSSTTEQAINEIMSSIEPFEPVKSKRRSVDAVPVPVPPPALKAATAVLTPGHSDKKKQRDSSESSSSDSEGSCNQSSTIKKVDYFLSITSTEKGFL